MKKIKPSVSSVKAEIAALFLRAKKEPKHADRFVKKSRRLAMHINLHFPRSLKRQFCKHCNTYFRGTNYRVRLNKGNVIYYCFTCKKYSKFPLAKKDVKD